MNCRTNFWTCLCRRTGTSEDVDVLPHTAHGVALHALVRQVEAAVDLPPLEGSAVAVLTVLRHRAHLLTQERGVLGAGGLYADELLVDDDEVVHSAEGVHDCGVSLVDEVLAAVLELELVGPVDLQIQVDDAG